jgi:hypothetical protein
MNIFTKLISFLSKVFSGSTGVITESILDLAIDAVLVVANTDLSAEGKKEKAFEIIRRRAAEEGIEVASHAINLAIELAVSSLHD